MNFGIQGTTTPRSYQRHLPGSARGRPPSGKSHRNPITGEEVVYESPRQPDKPVSYTKQNQKPSVSSLLKNDTSSLSLNLGYLKDLDVPSGAIDIDLNDYCLDSPGSNSTVSWGTGGRSHRSSYQPRQPRQPTPKSTRRPEGVPGLSLVGDGAEAYGKPEPPVKKVKQPTAWDKDPVPTTVQAAPSARYKDMYKQYEQDMKQSYRDYASNPKANQKEVEDAVEKIRSARQAVREQEEALKQKETKKEAEELNDSWTKQRYSSKQLVKKTDADSLAENNKRAKLVETVMIDQLSRAVISDPSQNDRGTTRPTSTSRFTKGSNRYLHDSKISTSSTATENLLSKRMRFGARILTRNGSDAMKELTGFYFACDKTITVYEFRQFGKSAKAMPFIYRGQYCHKCGPKQGLPYSLSDIHLGANLKISTEGQLALTDSLADSDVVTLRVTDVDQGEKDKLEAERADDDERMHAPSRIDMENKDYLYLIQDQTRDMIAKRAIRTITGLGRHYRGLDQYKTGVLDQYDLEAGLRTYRVNLEPERLEEIWEILDPEGMKLLDYGDYMHGVVGEMSEVRKALVRKAFHKLDCAKKGKIHISDVKKFFNVNAKYKPPNHLDTGVSALQAFLEDVQESDRQDYISYIEFEEYYEGLSISIDRDGDFANVLRNTWNI